MLGWLMHTLLSSCSSPGAPEWPGLGCSPCSRGVSSIPGSCENVCTATCPGPACCPGLLNVKNNLESPKIQTLESFGPGPILGIRTLGCCCHSTSALFLTLVPWGLLWLTAFLPTPPNPRTNRAFPSNTAVIYCRITY